MIVPDLYANKSVKWLQRLILTNDYKVNDTYATWNNDTESHLKTWACFVSVPETGKAGSSIVFSGVAQVGMNGLSKVQYWLHPKDIPLDADDPYFTNADWQEAEILPPPEKWVDLPDSKLPPVPLQIDPKNGKPYRWPMTNTLVHWAAVLRNVSAGEYELRCRAIDENGFAQPMPRPFLKSGYNAIQCREIVIT